MAFTAKPVSAERAERLGIINHMVAVERLESFVYALAQDIAENAPLAVSVMNEQLRMLAGAHPMSPRRFERVQGLRRIVYNSEDYAEGIRAFKEKRKPSFLVANSRCAAMSGLGFRQFLPLHAEARLP
jgi:methylmalonyl-CoA decarboxylase